MIDWILFFSAFFSVLWLLFLGLFWLEHHKTTLKIVREKAQVEYDNYVAGAGVKNQFLRVVSAVADAHILFPIRGVIIALCFISGFILLKKLA